jgi:hypothetical protein
MYERKWKKARDILNEIWSIPRIPGRGCSCDPTLSTYIFRLSSMLWVHRYPTWSCHVTSDLWPPRLAPNDPTPTLLGIIGLVSPSWVQLYLTWSALMTFDPRLYLKHIIKQFFAMESRLSRKWSYSLSQGSTMFSSLETIFSALTFMTWGRLTGSFQGSWKTP